MHITAGKQRSRVKGAKRLSGGGAEFEIKRSLQNSKLVNRGGGGGGASMSIGVANSAWPLFGADPGTNFCNFVKKGEQNRKNCWISW